MTLRPLKWILMAPVLSVLLLGHSFGSDVRDDIYWGVPPGQPEQMWSKVTYDAKLWDTFFESHVRGHPYRSGMLSGRGTNPEEVGAPREEITAICFSDSLGDKHLVEFCDARLVDENTIDLVIHHTCPGNHDRLRIWVRNGKFKCQFWGYYQIPPLANMVWTTTRQELTLDKEVYQKGDVIKGRIDFESIMEPTNPEFIKNERATGSSNYWTRTIKVYGVFKTIVE